jgi:hypothetical protein
MPTVANHHLTNCIMAGLLSSSLSAFVGTSLVAPKASTSTVLRSPLTVRPAQLLPPPDCARRRGSQSVWRIVHRDTHGSRLGYFATESPAWVTHNAGSALLDAQLLGFRRGQTTRALSGGGPERTHNFTRKTPFTQHSGVRVRQRNHRRPIDVADSRLMAASARGSRATDAHTDV